MATALQAVPHLTTANGGPLRAIEAHLLEHQARIEQWFRRQWRATPAPLPLHGVSARPAPVAAAREIAGAAP